LILVLQFLPPRQLKAQEAEAPFGLRWGATVDEIKSLGIELQASPSASPYGDTYMASKLPKSIAGQEATLLCFGHNNKLWRVAAISTSFDNDPYGSSAKNRYSELYAVLREKYGNGHSTERIGGSIFSEPNEFVYGIFKNESQWFTNFENLAVFIQLGLFAPDMNSLRWRLIYENSQICPLATY
jgi:hypothetical protein